MTVRPSKTCCQEKENDNYIDITNDRHAKRGTPSRDEICTILINVISNYSKVHIIIDALDE